MGIGSRLVTDLVAAAYDRALRRYARGRLLDLGCGKVPFYGVYRDRVDEATCVDWGGSVHASPYLDLEHDLTQPLPFDDGVFDTLLVSDVLEHIPNPEALFAEMARVLAPGGRMLLSVPFYYWLHEEPHDYYRYTAHALRRFVDRTDLRVIELEAYGGAPEVVTDVVAKCATSLPGVGGTLASLAQTLAGVFLQIPPGRRLSRLTRGKFPLGYLLVAEMPAGTRDA